MWRCMASNSSVPERVGAQRGLAWGKAAKGRRGRRQAETGGRMNLFLDEPVSQTEDPLDFVESVISGDQRFTVERGMDGDVHFSLTRKWTDAAGYVSFRSELPALLFTLGFDMRAPKGRRADAARLAGLINENLWLGHFDVWSDDGSIIFRHSLPMNGREEVSAGEVQALLSAAHDAAHRYHPAFQFLLNTDATPEEAASTAMCDIAGPA